jgi:glycosyltransferase involved in cell wall biosynthesis
MKIMLAVSSMQSGGAERVASTLVNAWAARGDSVTLVATFSGRGECFFPLSSKVELVYLADLAQGRKKGLASFIARFRAFRKLIRETKPDVIVSFLTTVNISTIVASRGLGVPHVASEHSNPLADGRSALREFMCRLVYPKAAAVTLLTQDVISAFKKRVPGIKNLVVLPNPVPDELLQKQRKPFEPGSRKRVVGIGRLHELKQFDILINAFSLLAKDFPDWDLWIWGEGSERASLEKLVTERELAGRVFLPGITSTPWDELARSQAFVLSSRYEGLPMALMEGMALGLPCVSFDCPSGPSELTRGGQDGVLLPPGNAQELAQALRGVLADERKSEEYGKRAAQSIRERYSIQRVLHQWDELFARVGAQR